MLADIASGHTSGADVLFLIAAILAGLACLSSFVPRRPEATGVYLWGWQSVLGWAAVTLLAVAWLILQMIAADVDWSNLSVAAAFIVGAISGTIGTIAVMRTLMRYLGRPEE